MRKLSAKIKLLSLLFLLLTQCAITDPGIIYATGTVKYITIEGGFYGIVTDNNESLDPVNLAEDFQKDGMRVSFSYKINKEGASFHMWGKVIEIVNISQIK